MVNFDRVLYIECGKECVAVSGFLKRNGYFSKTKTYVLTADDKMPENFFKINTKSGKILTFNPEYCIILYEDKKIIEIEINGKLSLFNKFYKFDTGSNGKKGKTKDKSKLRRVVL